VRWTRERKLPITAWEAHHIGAFLDESDLHKHHRYRYARLIERVFQHLATLRPGTHNPASVAAKQELADGENAPTTFLSRRERQAIEEHLASVPPLPRAIAVNGAEWRAYRDLAVLALFYGAGVKVSRPRCSSERPLRRRRGPLPFPKRWGGAPTKPRWSCWTSRSRLCERGYGGWRASTYRVTGSSRRILMAVRCTLPRRSGG